MNLLIFVFTLLILLSTITYSRLETVRNQGMAQPLLYEAMWQKERAPFEERMWTLYNHSHISEEEGEEIVAAETAQTPISAETKLNIRLFFDKKAREKEPDRYAQVRLLTHRLLTQLYASRAPFLKIAQEQPNYLDALLDALAERGSETPLTQTKELANLSLGEPLLDRVFAKMLEGFSLPGDQNNSYPSLLNLVSLKNGNRAIRIYLAPKELLMTLFTDPYTVEQIEQERYLLYKEVRANRMTKEEASRQFSSRFLSAKDPRIDPQFFNFQVTKTYPGRPQ